MCNKDTPLALNQSDGKPARKTRTRTRRPRFLSLRLELTPEKHFDPDQHRGSQLNLFPLRPAAAAAGSVATQPDDDGGGEDHKDLPDPDIVAAEFFHPDGGATLADLLADSSSPSPTTTTTLTYAYPSAEAAQVSGSLATGSLVRTAMRNKERDASEERWVRYSEVVEKRELEEVSSCSAGARDERGPGHRMSLKLDYDEVMNAWRDRGPPYVDGPEGSRTVPDVDDESPPHGHAGASVWMDGHGDSWGTAGYDAGFCTVPEIQKQSSSMEAIIVGRSVGDDPQGYGLKTGAQREASIQRYKEKRQARLFSKRIRYHVRKLNAEKRPRIKVLRLILHIPYHSQQGSKGINKEDLA